MKKFDEVETEEFDEEMTQEMSDEQTEEMEEVQTQELEEEETQELQIEPKDELVESVPEEDVAYNQSQIKHKKKEFVSSYTSSKNRTNKENTSLYNQQETQKVNVAVLLKQVAPYLVAFVLIATMVAGAFLYLELGYQDTMNQIQQIIQEVQN